MLYDTCVIPYTSMNIIKTDTMSTYQIWAKTG